MAEDQKPEQGYKTQLEWTGSFPQSSDYSYAKTDVINSVRKKKKTKIHPKTVFTKSLCENQCYKKLKTSSMSWLN